MILIKKIAVALISSSVGLVSTTVIATPFIAVANYVATDGPYFPAPLVALGLLAMPIGFLLFLIQAGVVAYEVIAKQSLGNILLVLGLVGGLAIGILWLLFLASSPINTWILLVGGGLGVLQGFVVFGCHWLASNWSLTVFEKRKETLS